eukprot:scaffold187740_cov33-Cyclotella_meneghiniana.AAC.1
MRPTNYCTHNPSLLGVRATNSRFFGPTPDNRVGGTGEIVSVRRDATNSQPQQPQRRLLLATT